MQPISIDLLSFTENLACKEMSPTHDELDLIDRITQIVERESLNFQNYAKCCCCLYPKASQEGLHVQVKTAIDANLQERIENLSQKIEQQDSFLERLRDTNHDKMKNALHGIFGSSEFVQTSTKPTTSRDVQHALESIQELSNDLLQILNENVDMHRRTDEPIDSVLNFYHLSSVLAHVGVPRSLYRDFYGYLFPLNPASTIVPTGSDLQRELQEALEENESSINPRLQQRISRLTSIYRANRTLINNLMLLNTQEMRCALEDISSYAEYLQNRRGFLSSDELEILKFKSARLAQLFQENVDFFHLVSGSFELSSEEFSLARLLEEFQSSHNANVVVNAPVHLPSRLVGDPVRIRTLLETLISNTSDSNTEDVINLVVSFNHIREEPEKNKILVRFNFTGKNSPPQKDEEPLIGHTSESATRRPYIAEALINLMDGEIHPLTSSRTSGFETKYAFTIKLEQSETVVSSLAKVLSEEEVKLRLRGKKILIVDDSLLNRKMITSILNKVGIITETAVDGADAVRILREDPSYDLVLMDLNMPVMDGFESAKVIRNELKLARLPILALSAEDPEISRNLALQAGMNAFATKPCTTKIFPLMDTLISESEETSSWEEHGLKSSVLALQNVSPIYVSRSTSPANLQEEDVPLQIPINMEKLTKSLLKLKSDEEITQSGY